MAKVRFLPDGNEVEVPAGTTLLEAAEKAGAQVGSSTCHVYVKQGTELLDEMDDDESDRLDMAFDVRPASRLSCQSIIQPGSEAAEIVCEITHESRQAWFDEHPKARPQAPHPGPSPDPWVRGAGRGR
jgi:2Fe-2S ferredoxin